MAARKQEIERDVALAWHVAAFSGQKRLKKLSEYLSRPAKEQSPAEMIAVLQQIKASGAPMNISRMDRSD